MRQSELATLFDYMYWANSRILVTAARLTDAQFTLPSVIAGRDLRATLVHTLDTECSWRLRLQRRPEEEWNKPLPLSDYRNVAALADHWKRDEAEMRAWSRASITIRWRGTRMIRGPSSRSGTTCCTWSRTASSTARNQRSCSRSWDVLRATSIFWTMRIRRGPRVRRSG